MVCAMVDSYIGQINATAQDIEGPAHGDWKDLSWFEKTLAGRAERSVKSRGGKRVGC